MTAPRISTIRKIGLTLGVALSLSSVVGSPSYAYSARARQMCTGDAFRLCSSEIPNISRIIACMRRNKASLSPGCRAVMDEEDGTAARAKPVHPAPVEHKPAAAAAAKPHAPVETKPAQAAPIEQKPATASPVVPPVVTETKAVPAPPVEPKPAAASPESAAVTEAKPAQAATPVEQAPAAALSVEQPAISATQPVQTAPAEQKPATPTYVERPAVIVTKPVQAVPVEQRPAIAAPVLAKPADTKAASSGKRERLAQRKPRHRQMIAERHYRDDYRDIERAIGIMLPLLMQLAW
ncbi:hypothetical protein [Bradyrhizobium liaoningense]|uniref:hypothetical protein n=1 Tax=Bradyrhizobium liaoningense TaxID=43992 RepID=UPI00289B623A|nr:hypothetical protein [Bradyrhizobium liaoningense]